jgi:hypothetical protein
VKKVVKIILAVSVLLLVVFCVYVLVAKPFKKITFSSISELLCDAVGIETEDPSEELLKLSVVSKNISARGEERLTNEEAYSIVSRMYLLVSDDEKPLGKIKDSDDISKAYKKDIAGLIEKRYLDNDERLKPKSAAKFKDIKNLILKIRGTDITESGSCHEKIGEGNLSVKSQGVALKDTVFHGDIILCDTPLASISLSNVTVKGRLIIRAAKNTSVSLTDRTEVTGGVYITAAGGEATVECAQDVFCNVVSNGSARLLGNISSVTILEGADVKTEGTVGIIKTDGAGELSLERGSFGYIYAESPGSSIRIGEGVHGEKVLVQKAFNGSTLNVAGNVKTLSCSSKNSVINIKGTAVLGTLDIRENSDKTNVLIEKRAKIENLNNAENSNAAVIDNRSQWDGRR